MRFVSFFAGIGGIDLGLERAGHECVGQVEIDPFCLKVLAKHWPDTWRHDDILTLKAGHIPEADLWTGGFPCQDISTAGKRAGIHGKRSGLFFDFMRLVREERPRYLLLENVAALLVRGMGNVLGKLAASGYDAEWDCFPAYAVGAEHMRERYFILAYSNQVGSKLPNFGFAGRPLSRHWVEGLATIWKATKPEIIRMDHGVPAKLDATRVAGCGNAVVPQVAEYIGKLLTEANP